MSQAASGYSSIGAPQLAPALFTSTWSAGSRAESSAASRFTSDSFERSAGSAAQVPTFESSAAASAHASALRDETYTRAPFSA